MDQKKISIIIPCYNVESYIDRCVESLVNQTIGVENLELIFVDDASTDATVECLKKWEERYPDSVLLVCCAENHRQGAARNTGLCYASADYIGYVDSDDWVDQTMYEKMYARVEQYHPDVVSVLYTRDYQDGRVEMTADPKKNGEQYVEIRTTEERSRFLQEGLVGGVWSGIYRREMLQSAEGLYFPEDLRYEDNYWSAILKMELSSYYIINEPLYHYMINENSTIMEQNATHHLDRLVIELMKIEEYKRRGLFAQFHDWIEFNFLRMYFINTIRILFVRFDKIPYDMVYTMQQQVLELFPDYEKNPYLDTLPQLQSELLKIVKVPLDEVKIDILANAYRKVLQESNI
ncbi:MAG: glycosyltransferase [Lachnospiraceae bacterium]|nr:glycosyltransferase [Lachnospiraceae bacterium]